MPRSSSPQTGIAILLVLLFFLVVIMVLLPGVKAREPALCPTTEQTPRQFPPKGGSPSVNADASVEG